MSCRPLKWSALLASLVCISGACKKPVDVSRSSAEATSSSSIHEPENSSSTSGKTTASATTTSSVDATPPPAQTTREAESEDDPLQAETPPAPKTTFTTSPTFYQAIQHAPSGGYGVNVHDCSPHEFDDLGPAPVDDNDQDDDDWEADSDTIVIPLGHKALGKALRGETHFTLIFEDETTLTRKILRYEFEEDGGGAYCYAILAPAPKSRKKEAEPLLAVKGKTKLTPSIRPVTLTRIETSEAEYEAFTRAFFKLHAQNDYFEDQELPEAGSRRLDILEAKGKHGKQTFRVRFLGSYYPEDDLFAGGAGGVLLDSAGKPVAVAGEWTTFADFTLDYWIDHDGDGAETLVLSTPYSEGLTVYAVDFDLKKQTTRNFILESHGL